MTDHTSFKPLSGGPASGAVIRSGSKNLIRWPISFQSLDACSRIATVDGIRHLYGPPGSNYERASYHPLTSVAGASIDMDSSDAGAELGVLLVQVQN
jgi:hypothetical protein